MRFLSAWLKSWFFDQKFFLHFAGFFVDTTDPSFRRRGEMSDVRAIFFSPFEMSRDSVFWYSISKYPSGPSFKYLAKILRR